VQGKKKPGLFHLLKTEKYELTGWLIEGIYIIQKLYQHFAFFSLGIFRTELVDSSVSRDFNLLWTHLCKDLTAVISSSCCFLNI